MKDQTITQERIQSYREYLMCEEKSAATVSKYLRDASAFAEFLNGRAITKELTVQYKSELLASGLSARSVNSAVASLNSLFAFLSLPQYKLKSIKLARAVYCPEQKELTRGEYMRLVNAAKAQGNIRLNLIIQTICSTGIRVSELQYITVESVHRGEAYVNCKGKTRTVFISGDLKKLLLSYISKQGIPSGAVFVTRSGKPIDRSNIWREMKSLCKSAGVNPNKVFPHNLRHVFARTFYGIEKDISRLDDILGHSSINTTRIYIITTGREHKRKIESMKLVL